MYGTHVGSGWHIVNKKHSGFERNDVLRIDIFDPV